MKKINDKAITLIALVITIIVLLILAGVSIAMLTGQNGILIQANEAKTNTEIAEAKERAKLDISDWQANELRAGRDGKVTNAKIKEILTGKEYVNGTPGETSFFSKKGNYEILYKDIYNVTESGGQTGGITVDGVPIPEGFYHVEGTAKENGLVISDVQGDDLENTKQGNQFVWIPVEDYSKFKRTEGYYNNALQTRLSNCGEADSTGVNSKIEENAEIQEEAREMYESVKNNKGFYIARYEAGKETVDGVEKLVSKKNAAVWNNIPWSNSDETNVITGGAVERARNFDTQEGYTNVKSTLIYGVQWDATMQFFDPNYFTGSCTEDSYVRNSTGKGWYSDNSGNSVHNTGVDIDLNKNNCIKNIYDMAGNVWEWTMEFYYIDFRVVRRS